MDLNSLRLPDRFEKLRQQGEEALRTIITPVAESLYDIDERFADMRMAERGAFVIVRGSTGAGKSTFLDTLHLFRKGIETVRIPREHDIEKALLELIPTSNPRVIVLESREALGVASTSEIEAAMHAINMFVRSDAGQDNLVAWPANRDDLAILLQDLANSLGGEALFGSSAPVLRFRGPSKGDYVQIAERTVAALNEGASLAAIGISLDLASELAEESETIGQFLSKIRSAARKAGKNVQGLMSTESYRVWTVVIAGTDTEGDVAALTRGGQSLIDIDRLMTSTEANVVLELKKNPDALGVLGTVLDARIIHVDLFTVLAVARSFGSDRLHKLMADRTMSIKPDKKALDRLVNSQLGVLMAGKSLGTRRRGVKPRGNTMDAFIKLAEIAQTNDGLLNAAFGRALQEASLIDAFTTEKPLGTKPDFLSDVYCERAEGPVRLEMMWRKETSRAGIANYVLGKLNNYGKGIGLLR
ncbi:hypothetical protein [Actinokineospora sp. NPDC004072]